MTLFLLLGFTLGVSVLSLLGWWWTVAFGVALFTAELLRDLAGYRHG